MTDVTYHLPISQQGTLGWEATVLSLHLSKRCMCLHPDTQGLDSQPLYLQGTLHLFHLQKEVSSPIKFTKQVLTMLADNIKLRGALWGREHKQCENASCQDKGSWLLSSSLFPPPPRCTNCHSHVSSVRGRKWCKAYSGAICLAPKFGVPALLCISCVTLETYLIAPNASVSPKTE
jgi:hypothetical protein